MTRRPAESEGEQWMRRALRIADGAGALVSPNPRVGAILAAGSRFLAGASHRRFGGPHAERRLLDAWERTGRRLPRDATLYVTLEPCAHVGKTGPCVDAILAAGISSVFVAHADPDPRVRGRGIRRLRRAGIRVSVGTLAEAAERLNWPFFLKHIEGRARISLKMAATLDGKLADAAGGSRWITGPEARREVGLLRAASDAVVVGAGTVVADDPRLTVRSRPGGRGSGSPSRIVVSSSLGFDPDCRLARLWRREVASCPPPGSEVEGNWVRGRTGWARRPRLIVACSDAPPRRVREFQSFGWEVWGLRRSASGVDLGSLARRAAEEGLLDLLIEPGTRLAGSFLSRGPVDRVLLFLAPRFLGGGRNDWAEFIAPRTLAEACSAAWIGLPRRVGDDLFVEFAGKDGKALVPPRRRGANRLNSRSKGA